VSSKRATRDRFWRGVARNECGAVLVLFVLFLPVLLGFAAFVLDVGHAFQLRRHLQVSADAAALAAAQELPNTATARSVANDYSARPGGRNENPGLPEVTTDVTFPGPVGSKVRVTESARSRVFFASVLGFSGFNVRATAVASKTSPTTGTPLAVYVHELCGAPTGNKGFIVNGLNARVDGGIHVNGHFELGGENFVSVGRATLYRPPPQGTSPAGPAQGPGCKNPNRTDDAYCTGCATGAVGQPEDGAYRDWVTPYHTEAIMKASTPCTFNHAGDVKYENQVIPNGIHCVQPDKKFTIAGNSSGNITVIGGFIEIGGSGVLRPFNPDHPVLFYSTNTAGTAVKLNPSGAYDWTGYIINRLGGIEINATGVTSPFNGLLEAEWILVNGENFRMLGTFPDSSEGTMSDAVVLEE
jgi:Flp pilus assembly protein TadG